MRKREYLSPSSISLFKKDPDQFYLRYLSDHRPPDDVQTQPMSVGSAFDAYVKSFLHEKLFGKGNDPKFDFEAIFEAQVQSQHRDFARIAGKDCFDQYLKCGALADLMLELNNAIGKPKFEFEIRGVVGGMREFISGIVGNEDRGDINPVVLLGKPDVFFINSKGAQIILDFKVNGYCSNYNISPLKGYIKLRSVHPNSKRANSQHKDAMIIDFHGMKINCAYYLNTINEDWAAQLSIYSWLCGASIGEPKVIYAIDQLVANKNIVPGKVIIDVAEHRLRIQKEFQERLYISAQHIWNIIHSDPFHYYPELTLEESQSRCALLDEKSRTLIENPEFLDVL